MLELYGAKLVFSPAHEARTRRRRALRIAEGDPATSCSTSTPTRPTRSHYEGTGADRRDASPCRRLRGRARYRRHPHGRGERLRESFPDVVAAAEPLQGDLVYGLRSLADGYVPPILDVSRLDRKVLVSNEESVAGLRRSSTAREFAGVSPGPSFTSPAGSPRSSTRARSSACSPTAGWKYLSAEFWTKPVHEAGASMEDSIWW